MLKRFANDYLSYSYKDRIGIFLLIGLIVICIFISFLYPYLITKKQYDHKQFDTQIAQLKLIQPDSFSNKKYASKKADEDNFYDYGTPSEKNYYPKALFEVFYFDPNTATPADWKRLGLRERTIETIQKYLSKGGKFYRPEDISKIWGLHAEDVKRLLPYIKIAQKPDLVKHEFPNSAAKNSSYVPKTLQLLDINTADTTGFIALPGIGSKLAQRIINFRNRLGGFYSVDQVSETFGLPDSTFQKIKPRLTLSYTSIKKININTASPDEFKAHPYIRYGLGNSIIQYRNQHGNFSSVIDIKKIMVVTEEVYKKIEPYITVTE
ncbi:MAG: helix-hairpin-helix domain-containing protein [Ginsengibacter sp.]